MVPRKRIAAPIPLDYSGIEAPGTGTADSLMILSELSVMMARFRAVSPKSDGKNGLWRWKNGILSKIVFDGDPLPVENIYALAGIRNRLHGNMAFDSGNFVSWKPIAEHYNWSLATNTPRLGTAGTFQSFSDLNFKNTHGQLSFRACN